MASMSSETAFERHPALACRKSRAAISQWWNVSRITFCHPSVHYFEVKAPVALACQTCLRDGPNSSGVTAGLAIELQPDMGVISDSSTLKVNLLSICH